MPFDPQTGEFFHGTLEAFRAANRVGLGILAGGLLAHSGALNTWVAYTIQLMNIEAGTTAVTFASEGGLVATGAGGAVVAGVLPVVVMVGVWVALGSGYYEAREAARVLERRSGFSQGFVAGVLGWTPKGTQARFWRRQVRINAFDEQQDLIRVNSYNGGLYTGYAAGNALPEKARKAFRIALRQAAGRHSSAPWSNNEDQARNEQISYVIELATAGLRKTIIK